MFNFTSSDYGQTHKSAISTKPVNKEKMREWLEDQSPAVQIIILTIPLASIIIFGGVMERNIIETFFTKLDLL